MLSIVAALCLRSGPPLNPAAVDRLVQRCKESSSWSLVVLKDGKTVVKRNFGKAWTMCNLMSATKSFTSIAIGMLVDEGKIPSLDTKLQQFFPEYRGKWKDEVTIRHLLEHTSGIKLYGPNDGMDGNRVASALAAPIVMEPGTAFQYNNRAVDLLSGVVRRVAGVPLDEYLNKRLFQPLGGAYFTWTRDPDGNPHGCAELSLSATDMAKVGQMMMQGGVWHGKRIVSQRYIDEATKPSKITDGTGEACGQLWWICQPDFTFDDDWKEKLRGRFSWPNQVIAKIEPLVGEEWPNYSSMEHDVVQTVGGYPYLESIYAETEFTWSAILKKREGVENQGYFANGWGGQLILVLPKDGIVAVRTGGEGFFDTKDASKYEMGDFYRLVRALYK